MIFRPHLRANIRLFSLVGVMLAGFALPIAHAAPGEKPNVILIMTDDQGYGDVAANGNEMIQTPNIDALSREAVRLTDYHVDPTCSPTRSALMTGRYSTRTGVWHTIMGRSLMDTNEVTIAETLAAAGYRTGMFGKWHLGDNYPLRPQDQGFEEVLCHGGGGVGQAPDYWGNNYFDDTYFHNGQPEEQEGYCTNVFFDGALAFIDQCRQGDAPFFCYLVTNAPHGPFLVAEEYSQPYIDKGVPQPMANFYGMITNIDDNLGRLRAALEEWGLAENTILIFTTDNGTAAGVARGQGDGWRGFNDGMRGTKGSGYDGGHRVPFFIHWPEGDLTGGRSVDTLCAHIDVLPTVAELCAVPTNENIQIDGTSLVPVLKGEGPWNERTLFVHSQRIEIPEKWRNCQVMTEQWRLYNGSELYDIQSDPGQQSNIAADHQDVVAALRAEYEGWWDSLSVRFDDHVRIAIGATQQNPTLISSHDWHANRVPWNHNAVGANPAGSGYWEIDVVVPGTYRFSLLMRPPYVDYVLPEGTARLKIGEMDWTQVIAKDARAVVFEDITLEAGPMRMQTWLTDDGGTERGAYYVDVQRLE